MNKLSHTLRLLILTAFCHVVTIACLAILPLVYPFFGWIYWTGVAAIAVLLIYEHALVRPDDLSRLDAAFFTMNGVISIAFFLCVLLERLLNPTGVLYAALARH